MRPRNPTASPGAAPAPRRRTRRQRPDGPRPPLSVIHAEALYQPVPPVSYDKDGYPYNDESVTESWAQAEARRYLLNVLRARYTDRADALVCGDLSLFFEQGSRGALVVPDVAVSFGVRGIRDGKPRSYKAWEQGKPPDFVLEVMSETTWRNDLHNKPGLYADLNVREYWLFDPDRASGGPQLWGGRLGTGGNYEPLPPTAEGGIHSPLLGLDLFHEGDELRCRVPETGDVIPCYEEYAQMHEAAQAQARAERERAKAAEARVAALEELLRQSSVR